jgi:hypothetical protein
VTIRGRHYVEPPLTPPLPTATIEPSPQAARSSLSYKPADGSQGWIKERFDLHDDSSDEETGPTSAISASSFGTSTGFSEKETERASLESNSSSNSSRVSPAERRQLRKDNLMEIPPQKPAPTGPLPQPPDSLPPSPVLRHRLSTEQDKAKPSSEKPAKTHAMMSERGDLSPKSVRGRENERNSSLPRFRSVPRSKDPNQSPTVYDSPTYDPFLASAIPMQQARTSPTLEPISASSISTKSTMPPTPPATFANVPSYYHAKPSYYLDHTGPKVTTRLRAQTVGSSSKSPISPISPLEPPAPTTSRVKFTDPEVMMDPPHLAALRKAPKPPATMEKLPFPRSPPEAAFPFRGTSPPPRKNLARSVKSLPAISTNVPNIPSPVSPPRGPATYSGRSPTSPSTYARMTTSHSEPRLPMATQPILGPSSVKSTGHLRSKSSGPSHISTTSTRRVSHPMPSPTKTSPPPAPRPTARPPLPSHAKARIVSMATDTTATSATASHAPTISTAPTSRSGMTGDMGPRAQVSRRPFALFPPLPPATLAMQQSRLAAGTAGKIASPTSPTAASRKQGNVWI